MTGTNCSVEYWCTALPVGIARTKMRMSSDGDLDSSGATVRGAH